MQIISEKRGKVVNARLIGELDHHAAARTRERLDALLQDPSVMELVLDLGGLTFMDSSGIGVIIGRYKVLSGRGGKLSVMRVNDATDRILKMAGMYNILHRA